MKLLWMVAAAAVAIALTAAAVLGMMLGLPGLTQMRDVMAIKQSLHVQQHLN